MELAQKEEVAMKNDSDDNKPWKALDDKAPKLPSSSRQEQWVPKDHVLEDDGGRHDGDGDGHNDGDGDNYCDGDNGGDGDNDGDGDGQLFWIVLIRTTLTNAMTMQWWWKYCQVTWPNTAHTNIYSQASGMDIWSILRSTFQDDHAKKDNACIMPNCLRSNVVSGEAVIDLNSVVK